MANQSLKYSLVNHQSNNNNVHERLEITQRRIQVLKMENILSAIDTKLVDRKGSTRVDYHAN